MQIFRHIQPLRSFLEAKRQQKLVTGLVPTMGSLHAGHLSLVNHSKKQDDLTICSIYVNPLQFNNKEDLKNYPRMPEQDQALLEKTGCDALFMPDDSELYGPYEPIRFDFGNLDAVMEGKFRPGHFSGVAMVVSKFLNIVQPTRAYFGQKDWQQVVIIRHLVNQLKFNTEIHTLPIVRDSDGLALSSRNTRLNAELRKSSPVFYEALVHARELLAASMPVARVKEEITRFVNARPHARLEYFEVADSENLFLLDNVEEAECPILCIAGYIGDVRLIDNMFY